MEAKMAEYITFLQNKQNEEIGKGEKSGYEVYGAKFLAYGRYDAYLRYIAKDSDEVYNSIFQMMDDEMEEDPQLMRLWERWNKHRNPRTEKALTDYCAPYANIPKIIEITMENIVEHFDIDLSCLN